MHPKRFPAAVLMILGTVLLGTLPLRADKISSGILQGMKAPDTYNANLARLVGSWKGKGKLRPARRFPVSSVKCKMTISWIEDGRMVKQHTKCKSFLLSLKRTTYIAFDKASGRYVGRDFGNLGPNNVSLSGTGSGKIFRLQMVHKKPGSGKIVRNNLTITSRDASTMHSVMIKKSSRPYEVLNVLYRRVGGSI